MNARERLNVHVRGQGATTLVLGHGLGSNQEYWRELADRLEIDYRLILYDMVGFGGSRLNAYVPERYGTLKGYVQDLLELCAELELQDAHFVGHSVSAMLGLSASLEAPSRFASLTLIGASPRYLNEPGYRGGLNQADVEDYLELMEQNYMGWVTSFVEVAARQPELTQRLSASFGAADSRMVREFARLIFYSDHRQMLDRVSHPCLIIHNRDDDIAPVDVACYLHQHLRGSTLRFVEAAGHCPHVTHPAEVERLLREFLPH